MRDFDGKVAVVTGAASGMGLAFAERWAREGAKVVMSDIEEDALDAAVARLRQQEFDVIGAVTDVATETSVQKLHDRAIAEYGKVHLLFNNAGVFGGVHQGPIWDATQNDWQWLFGVNVWGVVHGVRTFLPGMLAHGEPAHIVNTASIAGLVPAAGVYGITKHAVVAFSEVLYSQLGGMNANVGVSVLCPGGVRTRIMEGQRNRQAQFADADEKPAFRADSRVRASIEGGLEPEQVAERLFEAVREGQFYVVVGAANERIEERFRSIIEQQNPAVQPYDPATADAM